MKPSKLEARQALFSRLLLPRGQITTFKKDGSMVALSPRDPLEGRGPMEKARKITLQPLHQKGKQTGAGKLKLGGVKKPYTRGGADSG